jgi:hypothetical protein
MSIYSALLKAALLFFVFSQSAYAASKPQFVYVGNIGDDTVSVFAVNGNGTLKPLEPRVASPMCGQPTLLATGHHILLVGGEYTAVCSGPDLGGGVVYLYPILPSGKLGTASPSYLNDVESIALSAWGRLAFSSGATLNPHSEAGSITGWYAASQNNLNTMLPGSPTNFFDFQTGDGYLPGGLAVSPTTKFLFSTFSKYSSYNDVGDGLIGVFSLLLDGGVGSFVNEPTAGCVGPKISGGGSLLMGVLKSTIVLYQSCSKGAGVNVVGTPVIGISVVNSSTGKIEKVYDAFVPSAGVGLYPIAVDYSSKWLAASDGKGKIYILSINQSTGKLSELPNHAFNVDANTVSPQFASQITNSVAFDHTGKFLYVAQANNNKNVVAAFAFDSKTGIIKLPALGTQSTGPAPTAVIVAEP